MANVKQRRVWTTAGVLLGAAVLAWLASMGAGRIAAHYLSLPADAQLIRIEVDGSAAGPDVPPPPPGEAPPPPGPSPKLGSDKRAYVDPIVRRNIFDSSKVGAEVVDTGDGDSDRKTDLKVKLLATVVAEPETYSSALISGDDSDATAMGYGVGDTLLGEAKIYRIEQRRVILQRNDGSLEYLAMDENAKKASTKESGSADAEGEEGGVEKAGENKFVVDAALVEAALENPEQLYSQIRAVPHKGADGEIDGYRLSGIRRQSLFHRLGIKNGDVVHTVNGKSLDSMQNAMDAYQSLQSEKNFSFEITRRNKRQTFEYEIR